MSTDLTSDRVADRAAAAVNYAAAAAENARLASQCLSDAPLDDLPRTRYELLGWLAHTVSRVQASLGVLRRHSRGDLAEDLAAASACLSDAARRLNLALATASDGERS